jgi:NTP pyrophosphatase (non-canonical NTP hydrolase)
MSPTDPTPDHPYDTLRHAVRRFAQERDWKRYHAPKNLACALSVEAAELLEHFQWMSEADSRGLGPAQRDEVAAEMADVFIYLLQLADEMDVDLIDAARRKMVINARKYPAPAEP